MSLDADFAALTFPALRHPNQDAMDAKTRIQGHAAGYASGLRSAAKEAELRVIELNAESAALMNERNTQFDAALAALETAARQLHTRAIPTIEEAQEILVASALELAEAILGYELNDTPTSAKAALARVIGHADPRTLVTVRMNSQDIAALDAAGHQTSNVEILADDTIATGDAVGDFTDGYLDARIQTALARARAALLGETI